MEEGRLSELRTGVRIEVVTVIWMVIEMAASLAAGIAARSVVLTAFGVDSLIELVGGGILLWRLSAESRGAAVERVERAERRATGVVAITLALLCVYVLASALYGLLTRTKPDASIPGILISATAVFVMPYLASVKRSVATRIQSDALAADAVNSITCAYMAGTALLGVALNTAFGWWWADDLAALLFLVWLVRETLEAFEEARKPIDSEGHTHD